MQMIDKNTSEVIPETECAWAAGFFDGEGSISFARSAGTHRYLQISVSNRNVYGLQRLHRLFGGNLYFEASRQCSRWTLSSGKAVPFLNAIRPYVSQKGEVIDIALEFQSTIMPRGRQHVPDEVWEYREQLWQRLRAVNAKD